MKAVFLSLVLLNLAYLAWQAWIVPDKAPPLSEVDGVPRLVLIGEDPGDPGASAPYAVPARAPGRATEAAPQEVAEEPVAAERTGRQSEDAGLEQARQSAAVTTPVELPSAADDTPEPVEVAVVESGLRCVSLGPFLDLREATEASAMLIEIGLQPSQRLSESQVWFGHWVHLAPLESREAAVAVVEGLRRNGVTDIYIEPSGPMKNSISLGVFSDREHAETRAGAIRKFGISPQIRDRYRDSSVYWVDFEMPEGQVIDPNAYHSTPNRVLRLEGRTCPANT